MLKLAWRQGRHVRTTHCVVLDLQFPWPGLHHGRNCARHWAAWLKKERETKGDFGPYALKWPMRVSVVDHDQPARIVVWPVQSGSRMHWVTQGALPRAWQDDDLDRGWRPVVNDLAHRIAAEIKCEVRVEWMPGNKTFEKLPERSPSIAGIGGFYGWKKGEQEPREYAVQKMVKQGLYTKSLQMRWLPLKAVGVPNGAKSV